MVHMDSELPVVGETPLVGSTSQAIPVPAGSTASAGDAGEAAFGRPSRTLRKRVGSALAGIAALAAKFGAYLKAGVLLLPKLALLSSAGTALVSIAAYSLLWGWSFAAGFVALLRSEEHT